jgi:hypothetical protein
MSRTQSPTIDADRDECTMPDNGLANLDELDRLEWWDVARRVNPRITWAEFLHQWAEFQRLKAARKAN